jgi:hypothetical protein
MTTLRFDPLVGLSLTELALLQGVARERARLLIEPFLSAGILEERDGVLVVVDPLVVSAFVDWTDDA